MGQATRLHRHITYTAFILLGIIWGSNFFFMKRASTVLDANQIVFVRLSFGFIPVLVVAIVQQKLRWRHIKQLHHFCVMAVIATGLYYMAYAMGASLLPSSVAGMLSGSITLFAALSAWSVGQKENQGIRSALGIVMGFFGILCVSQPWSTQSASDNTNMLGVILMIVGSVSLGVGTGNFSV